MTTDERIERLEQTVNHGFAEIKEYLLEFRTEMIQRLRHLEGRVDVIADTNRAIDIRLPGLTSAIMELQVRMDKLEKPAA
jgi:hypothetical protein